MSKNLRGLASVVFTPQQKILYETVVFVTVPLPLSLCSVSMEEPNGSGDEGDPYPFLSDRGPAPPGSIYDIMGGRMELGLGTTGGGGSGSGRGGVKARHTPHKV